MSIKPKGPSIPVIKAKDFKSLLTNISRKLAYSNTIPKEIRVICVGEPSKWAAELAINDFSGHALITSDIASGDYSRNPQLAIPVSIISVSDFEDGDNKLYEYEVVIQFASTTPIILSINNIEAVHDPSCESYIIYKAQTSMFLSPQLYTPEEVSNMLRELLDTIDKYISLGGPINITTINGTIQMTLNSDTLEDVYSQGQAIGNMQQYANLISALTSAIHTVAMSMTIGGYLKYNDLKEIVTGANLEEVVNRLTSITKDVVGGMIEAADITMNDMIAELTEETTKAHKRRAMTKIGEEIGGEGTDEQIAEKYRERLTELKKDSTISDESVNVLDRAINRFESSSPMSQDKDVQRTYLDFVLFDLPWTNNIEERADFEEVERVLEESHHGLKDPKRAILHYLAARKLCEQEKRDQRSVALLFIGPPGIGKTSLAKAVGEALGRPTVQISLGGVHDESEIRGHRRTYVGAMPGRIMDGISRAKANNCVFVIDEADKTATSMHGNPQDALLEVIDPEQNDAFKDHYIDIKYDLSNVLFILTANDINQISPPLIDRCEVVFLHSYIHQEKMTIAKQYLLPRQIKRSGLYEEDIEFPDGMIDYITQAYTGEAGVRNLERSIGNICKAVAIEKLKSPTKFKSTTVTLDLIHDELGPPQYSPTSPIWSTIETTPGTTNYMAWTSNGGKIGQLQIATIQDPEAKTDIITGNLKEVMKESIAVSKNAAINIASSINNSSLVTYPIFHIHFCENAIPKDGPSAGVPITMAMVSRILNSPLRKDISATGEVSLDGTVTKIGGVREKITAAILSQISTIYLPKENEADFDELPDNLKKQINIKYISHIKELFPDVLLGKT